MARRPVKKSAKREFPHIRKGVSGEQKKILFETGHEWMREADSLRENGKIADAMFALTEAGKHFAHARNITLTSNVLKQLEQEVNRLRAEGSEGAVRKAQFLERRMTAIKRIRNTRWQQERQSAPK